MADLQEKLSKLKHYCDIQRENSKEFGTDEFLSVEVIPGMLDALVDCALFVIENTPSECEVRELGSARRYWCHTCTEYGGAEGCAGEQGRKLIERLRVALE